MQSLAHLAAYGCRAYLLSKNIPKLQKLQPRAHIRYLVGYNSTNIFRIWVPSLKRVIESRDVTFDETKFYDPTAIDLELQQALPELVEVLDISAHSSLDTDEGNEEVFEEEIFDTIVVANHNSFNSGSEQRRAEGAVGG